MWDKDYKVVEGIVKKVGSHQFEIDFDKLAVLTKNHETFIDKVRAEFDRTNGHFEKVVVFIDEKISQFGPDKGEKKTLICIAVDNSDTYISLLGCDVNHEKHPFIFEFSQNKTFVCMMSKLL